MKHIELKKQNFRANHREIDHCSWRHMAIAVSSQVDHSAYMKAMAYIKWSLYDQIYDRIHQSVRVEGSRRKKLGNRKSDGS